LGETERAGWLAGTILQAAERAGIGVTVTLADGGLRNVMVSPAATAIFGRDGALARDPLCIFDYEQREKLQRSSGSLSEVDFPKTMEKALERSDGGTVSLEVGLGPISLGQEHGVLAFVTDVTHRRSALESLRNRRSAFVPSWRASTKRCS